MRRAPGERERHDPERCREDLAVQAEVLAAAVLVALQAGDVEGVIRALGPHPRVVVDCGREQGVTGWPLLLRALGFTAADRLAWRLCSVNGGPALVGSRAHRVVVIVVLAGAIGAVTDVWIVANPDKLRHWSE